MNRLKVLVLLAIYAVSCGLSNQDWPLSEVYIFGDEHHEIIINRVQEYGDGTPNGCLIPGMMRVDITLQTPRFISGTVKSVRTLESLPKIYLIIQKSGKTEIEVETNVDGQFAIPRRMGDRLIIKGLGYETMTIEYEKLLELIEENESAN
ncbi:MAG: hypothetical protein HWE14_10970 [Flavobacteriia bacterium]|nr:hypothetical protein [Flavobacteriia bacterium]